MHNPNKGWLTVNQPTTKQKKVRESTYTPTYNLFDMLNDIEEESDTMRQLHLNERNIGSAVNNIPIPNG